MGEETVTLGVFVRPVGLKGEVKFLPAPDFWIESLDSDKLELSVGARAVEVLKSRPAGNCLVMRLSDVRDRDGAEALRDVALILKGELDVPPPDSPRPFQVRGMKVFDAEGSLIGEVSDLVAMPGQSLLQVKGSERAFEIPFVSPILRGIDWEAGRIEVDPPPGLLEL